MGFFSDLKEDLSQAVNELVIQADTEENISTDGVAESPLDGVTDDAAKSSEAQEPTKEEDWEDKALLEEYAAYGIEKDGDFYYYQGELVYPESVKLIVFICQSTIRLAKSRKCTLIMLNKPVLM